MSPVPISGIWLLGCCGKVSEFKADPQNREDDFDFCAPYVSV
jgi:hypothetical protein